MVSPPEAGASAGDVSVCKSEGLMIDLDAQLVNADPGGVWTWPDSSVVTGGLLNTATVPAGAYIYNYKVNGNPPCPADDALVNVFIQIQPFADAGLDDTLNCSHPEATLGGENNSAGVTYDWSGAVSDPATLHPLATDPGLYVLTVITTAGCTDADSVLVPLDEELPVVFGHKTEVTCFGENDGVLKVDSVTGGNPPYQYSLDGGDFSSVSFF